MNLTNFHPKKYRKLGKNNRSVNIRIVAKTSDISNISQNITSDVKSQVASKLSFFQPELFVGCEESTIF